MASLPVVKSLQAQDFPTQQSWISPLLYTLNLVFGSLYSALNNGLTIGANSLAQLSTVAISKVNSAYYAAGPTAYATPATTQAVTIPWKFKSRVVGCYIVSLVDTSASPRPVILAVSCDWTYTPGTVTINSITGLDATRTYNCTFHIIGG